MGYPGKNHKQYQTPKRPFEKTRIEEETRLVIEYGLRNKREVWKAQAYLRRYRKAARDLLSLMSAGVDVQIFEAKKAVLIDHIQRMGLLGPDADIDDVLSLKVPAAARKAPSDTCIPPGACKIAETGTPAYYPRTYCHQRQEGVNSGIPCETGRGDSDLILREIPADIIRPCRAGKNWQGR